VVPPDAVTLIRRNCLPLHLRGGCSDARDARRLGDWAIGFAAVTPLIWLTAALVPAVPYSVLTAMVLTTFVTFPFGGVLAVAAVIMVPRGRGWVALAMLGATIGSVYLILHTGDFGR
jgi:hypothetical protein